MFGYFQALNERCKVHSQVFFYLQDGSNQAASQRAYHPDELNKREDLKIGLY
jgi:hypothetical protein